MPSDDKLISISRVVNGLVGLLLAVVGYFLVGRDSEVKSQITTLWHEVGDIRATVSGNKSQIDRLTDAQNWILQQNKDQEERLRHIENMRGGR